MSDIESMPKPLNQREDNWKKLCLELERERDELRELYALDTQCLRAERNEAKDELTTVNAERAEARDLRKAWIDSDNLRQKLQAENEALQHKLEICMAANSDVERIAMERDALADALRVRVNHKVCPECKRRMWTFYGHLPTCPHYETENKLLT